MKTKHHATHSENPQKTEGTQWNATQDIVPMNKRIKEPFMMVAMIDRMKPTHKEFSDENGDKKHVVPIEISVQMCVVPIVKHWQPFLQKVIYKVDGKAPFNYNIGQVDNDQ
jgi:hypothetical protein